MGIEADGEFDGIEQLDCRLGLFDGVGQAAVLIFRHVCSNGVLAELFD